MQATSTFSGGERYTVELATAIARHVDVQLVSQPGSPLMDPALVGSLPFKALPLGDKLGSRTLYRNAVALPRARRELADFASRETAADNWVVLQYKWEELLLPRRLFGGRIALLEHGPIPRQLLRVPPARRRLRRVIRDASVVFIVSEGARSSVCRLFERPVVALQPGVSHSDIELARARSADVRSALGIPDTLTLAVYAGRLARNKGILRVIDALAADERLGLIALGVGPDEDAFRARAEEMGVERRVWWLGWRADRLKFIAAADVLVLLTSDPGEGHPLSALEAVALGLPVVGPSESPAMRSLADEYGPDRIFLCGADGDVAATIALAGLRSPSPGSVRSWDEVADRFLNALRAVAP